MTQYPSAPECRLDIQSRVRGQVEEQLDELSNMVSEISDQIDRLVGKLSPVTRDCPPDDCDKGACLPYLVPVADQVRSSRMRLASLIVQLDSLFNRIEL